jgi:hypothetical protein
MFIGVMNMPGLFPDRIESAIVLSGLQGEAGQQKNVASKSHRKTRARKQSSVADEKLFLEESEEIEKIEEGERPIHLLDQLA